MTEEVTVHRQQHFRAARGAVVAGKVDMIALHQLYVAAEYSFAFKLGENAFAGLLADVLNRCTNGNKRKVAGLCRGRFAFLVGIDDGLGDGWKRLHRRQPATEAHSHRAERPAPERPSVPQSCPW